MRPSATGRGWHLLRHTFARRLAQQGVSLYKIAAWLGHRDIRTTQVYAHLQAAYDPEIERAGLGGPQRRAEP
jgi:integrase